MKFIGDILKLIQVLSLLIVPVIVLYWVLIQIDLASLEGIKSILGFCFNNLLAIVAKFGEFTTNYDGYLIDFKGLIVACAFIVNYMIFNALDKLNSFFIKQARLARLKKEREEEEARKQHARAKYLQNLQKYNIYYLIVKFNKKESALSYLCTTEEDKKVTSPSEDLIQNILDSAVLFDCKQAKELENDINSKVFVFDDMDKSLEYSIHINDSIKKSSADLVNAGENVSFNAAFHCGFEENEETKDIALLQKVLNLSGNNQIMVTQIFKNRYTEFKKNSKIEFTTQGMYTILRNKLEIFNLKIK